MWPMWGPSNTPTVSAVFEPAGTTSLSKTSCHEKTEKWGAALGVAMDMVSGIAAPVAAGAGRSSRINKQNRFSARL
jgi:hypothetical protein